MLLPSYQKGTLVLPAGATKDYLRLGSGPIPVVVVPGAGDGLRTARDAALSLAWYFRKRAKTHRLLVLSRRQPIPPGFTPEQLADDYIWAVEELGFGPAFWECNSAGGPIGQWVALKRPDLVKGLILSSTLHRADDHLRQVLSYWIQLARQGRWSDLNWSSIEYTFRPETVRLYRLARSLLRFLPKPRDPERLERVFEGLLSLDYRAILANINIPTLVVGGVDDWLIDVAIQREIARLIPGARAVFYPGFGHGNDQENPNYEVQANRFMRQFAGQLGSPI